MPKLRAFPGCCGLVFVTEALKPDSICEQRARLDKQLAIFVSEVPPKGEGWKEVHTNWWIQYPSAVEFLKFSMEVSSSPPELENIHPNKPFSQLQDDLLHDFVGYGYNTTWSVLHDLDQEKHARENLEATEEYNGYSDEEYDDEALHYTCSCNTPKGTILTVSCEVPLPIRRQLATSNVWKPIFTFTNYGYMGNRVTAYKKVVDTP
jgi:hypothetical protein